MIENDLFNITLAVLFLVSMFMLIFRRHKQGPAGEGKWERAQKIVDQNWRAGLEEHGGKDGL